MYNIYNNLKDERISLAYFGVFSDNITSMLIDLSEGYMLNRDHLTKLSKKTSFLIAESFQNVIKHGIVEKEGNPEICDNKDFFQINFLDDRINISSVNLIENEFVEDLQKKINHINSLDSVELKQFQKQVLVEGEMSAKSGASLGLIEMVRKTGLPLKKHFTKVSDKYSQVILGMEMPINKDVTKHKIDIEQILEHYKYLQNKGVLILYKGDFSQASNANIIEMLHNNFVTASKMSSEQTKNIVAIIEVMQNVSKHGKSINDLTEGVFSINKIGEDIYIECGNFIEYNEYESFKNNLKSIKASTYDEILKLYRLKLSDPNINEQGNTGLGLLEIARYSKNTFTYEFEEINDKQIFFSIKIKTE